MTYPDAIQFLYGLRWFGAKFGLHNTLKLASLAGNPQRRLRFIHVAGTNGKGSTCGMLESIYRAAGLRVGLFTSPHLVSFRERIQINRQLISEEEVAGLVAEMMVLLQAHWGSGATPALDSALSDHPTFFEVVTVMALRHFAAHDCELVIWETGMGGRLDATNIVRPMASVITNIQHDHEKWLGETLEMIAAEKAGIIKPGVPVLTATEAAGALRVIESTARKLEAPLTVVTPRAAPDQYAVLDTVKLPLLGEHQRTNAALAVATVQALQRDLRVDDKAVRQGLARVHWPGRFQVVERPNDQRVVLDGAHNPAGAEVLAAALAQHFGRGFVLVLGILKDKDWRRMCEILAPLATRILVMPAPSERSAAPPELAEACRWANPQAEVIECASLSEALAKVENEKLVVIAGSLYLVGEALELLGLSPADLRSERELNEWSPARA